VPGHIEQIKGELLLVQPMKGTWAIKGNEVALTITEMMGRKMSEIVGMARTNYANDPSPRNKAALDELSKPMIGILSSDGKTLTMKPAPGKAATRRRVLVRVLAARTFRIRPLPRLDWAALSPFLPNTPLPEADPCRRMNTRCVCHHRTCRNGFPDAASAPKRCSVSATLRWWRAPIA